jgi:chondroitin AC lyase
MIPGTTTFHTDAPLPVLPCSGYNIASEFVGGVSDGMNGIATLAYNRDSLYAQKSWFFFDDAIICLGAGIHANENKEIRTTINQSFLNSNVLVKQAARPQVLEAGEHSLANVAWVVHDNWGYFFPGKANIELTNREQVGDWHTVVKRIPTANITAGMFTVWFRHPAPSKAGHYAYYVFPAATAENMDARGAAFEVAENSARLQVVENPAKQMAGLVFVQAAEANTKTFHKISADKPCVLMISKKYAVEEIAIADPTHRQTSIVLGLQGKKKCATADAVYNKTKDKTFLTIPLPQGPEAGKTVRLMVE